MKKKLLLLVAILFMAAAMCPTAMAQTVKLRYVDHNPESGEAAQRATLPLLQSMKDATGGNLELETYFGETLLKTRDTWDGLKNGIADIGWMVLAYWPGKTPMTDAFGLPGLAYETPGEYGGALWNAYQKYPEMQSEYKRGGIRPLIFFASEPYVLTTTKKPIKTLEDLQGLKIRSLGGAATTQIKALNAVPLSIPMPDNYISLQKGVMDGMASSAEAICIWRFYEVLNNVIYAPLPISYFTMAINERQWNKLPAEMKEQIMTVLGYEGSKDYSDKYFGYFVEALPEIASKNGRDLDFYTLPEEEAARWVKASEPAYTEYFEYAKKKGVESTARKLVDDLVNGAL